MFLLKKKKPNVNFSGTFWVIQGYKMFKVKEKKIWIDILTNTGVWRSEFLLFRHTEQNILSLFIVFLKKE